MKYGLSQIRNYNPLYFDTATSFVKQNWMKMLIITFALFVILKKDISFNLNLQAAGSSAKPLQEQPEETYYEKVASPEKVQIKSRPEAVKSSFQSSLMPAAKPSKKPAPKQTTKYAVRDASDKEVEAAADALPYFNPDEILDKKKMGKKRKVAKKKVAKVKDNRANTFANLAFILNPTYAKRKNIDREIVFQKQENVMRYVKRYADIAVSEMKKFGIPASITLAQGLLESDAGESRLSKANNNHFGIKCFSKKCGRGHCANFTDDTHKDFFRKYKNVWESYRSHSTFLQGKRYVGLKELGTTDYKAWAKGLREAGYATDKKYAEKLIRIIETLELQEYDE